MKTISVGYRSGRTNLKVSAVASCALVGLFYISSYFSNVPERKNDSNLSKIEDIAALVQDSSASEDIEVYSSIYGSGSYLLIK